MFYKPSIPTFNALLRDHLHRIVPVSCNQTRQGAQYASLQPPHAQHPEATSHGPGKQRLASTWLIDLISCHVPKQFVVVRAYTYQYHLCNIDLVIFTKNPSCKFIHQLKGPALVACFAGSSANATIFKGSSKSKSSPMLEPSKRSWNSKVDWVGGRIPIDFT